MFSQVVEKHLGDVAQLVRALPCHGRGRGFEPRRPRHTFQKTYGMMGPKVTSKSGSNKEPLSSSLDDLRIRFNLGRTHRRVPSS